MAVKFLNGIEIDGTGTVLDIQGTQGQLFSVTDSLTGDLFSVSDISGVPILNVNSSGVVNIDGKLGINNDLPTYGLDIDLDSVNDRINITAGGAQKAIIGGNGNITAYGSLTSYGNSLSGGGGIFNYKGGYAGQTMGHRFQHVTGAFTGSSGDQTMMQINPTINQTSSAGYTGIKLDVTETATGSGTKNLLDLQVGSASKLSVSNTGAAVFAGTVTANSVVLTGDQDLSGYLTSLGTAIVDADFSGTTGLMKKSSAGVYTLDTSAYITTYSVSESDVTTHQAALSITESQISDLQSYTTGAHPTDFVSAASGGTFSGTIEVKSAIGAADNVRSGLTHDDNTAMAAGVGGQLVLGYKYTSAGDYTEGAILKMYKENGSSGQYGSGLKFQVRNHAADLSTKMTLDPSGNIDVTGTVTANSVLLTGDQDLSSYLTSETSHSDVLVDGDFTSAGFMKRGANSGDYSIDTNTYITSQRAISSTPSDGATTTAISSDWAFDNVKTAVPTSAVFTDTVPTDFVSAANGGTFSGNIDLNDSFKWAKNQSNSYTYSAADSTGMYIERFSTAGAGSALADMRFQARDNNTGTYNSIRIKGSDNTVVITSPNTIISGNLTVNGTTVTVDTTNLNVQDNNITLNYSTGDSSSTADNAGITIQDAVDASNNATMLWDATNDKFAFSHAITAGGVALTGDQDLSSYLTSSSTDLDSRYYTETEVTNLLANKTDLNSIRSLGANAFTNGSNPSINTSQVMSEIESDGGFDSYSSVFKTSWSYAGNYNLTDAGRFTETAGSSWITWTDNSSDTTRGNITALAIAPNTGGSAGKVFIYNDQGGGYSPGWREVWTSTSDGASSGLDADLLDGQHGSHYLAYANLTGKPATFAPIIGSTSATAMAGNTTIPSGNQILDWTASISETVIHSSNINFPTMYTHPSYATTNINTTGSTIVDSITTNGTGHITAMGTRTLALSDLGFSGNSAANCVLNAAQTLTNKVIDADNNTISDLVVSNLKASAVVLESEGISSNDNDTTIPTSAAVKDYVDNAVIADTDTQDLTLSGNTITLDRGGNVDISGATAVSANSSKTSFPGFGTSNTTALRGDTSIPSISGLASTSYVDTAEADAITAAASAAASIYVPSTGTTTIAGTKTFTGSLILNDGVGSSPTQRFMNADTDEVSIFCNPTGKMNFQQKLAGGSNVVQMTMDENGLNVVNGIKLNGSSIHATDTTTTLGTSDTLVPSQKAVKTYVDAEVSGAGGGTMSNWLLAASGTSGTETIDQGETVTFAGGTGITTSRNGQQINIVNSAPAGSTHLNSNVTLVSLGAQASGTYSTATGVENNADVTDATNVAAAGAVMDGDFTANGLMKRTSAGAYSVDTNTYLTAVADNHITLARMAGLTRGSIIVGDSNGDPSELTVGSDNHVLTVDSNGDIGWEAASGGGSSLPSDPNAYGILVWDNTANAAKWANAGTMLSITSNGSSVNSSANNYSHPTGAGNKHIPTGGSAGKFLKYSSSGTATWATPSYTNNTNTTYQAGSLLDLDTTTSPDTFNVDLTEATAATIAAGDNIVFIDGGATGTQSKGSINDVATLFAGTGLTATSGVLAVDIGNGLAFDVNTIKPVAGANIVVDGSGISVSSDIQTTTQRIGRAGTSGMTVDFSATDACVFETNATTPVSVFTIRTNTNATLAGILSCTNVNSSDERIKKDIVDIPGYKALEAVQKIRCVRYNLKEKHEEGEFAEYHKDKPKNGLKEIGFVAQNLEKVLPELVHEIDDDSDFKSVDYSKMVVILTEAMKEQQKQIDELKNKINQLI